MVSVSANQTGRGNTRYVRVVLDQDIDAASKHVESLKHFLNLASRLFRHPPLLFHLALRIIGYVLRRSRSIASTGLLEELLFVRREVLVCEFVCPNPYFP